MAERTIEAVVGQLGVVDRDGDIVAETAVEADDVLLSDYGHSVVLRLDPPVGAGRIRVDDAGRLIFRGEYFATDRAEQARRVVRALGGRGRWSIGYRVHESREPGELERRRGARQVLTRVEVFEVSPVATPAASGTATLDVKIDADGAFARLVRDQLEQAELRVFAAELGALDRRFPQTLDDALGRAAARTLRWTRSVA